MPAFCNLFCYICNLKNSSFPSLARSCCWRCLEFLHRLLSSSSTRLTSYPLSRPNGLRSLSAACSQERIRMIRNNCKEEVSHCYISYCPSVTRHTVTLTSWPGTENRMRPALDWARASGSLWWSAFWAPTRVTAIQPITAIQTAWTNI